MSQPVESMACIRRKGMIGMRALPIAAVLAMAVLGSCSGDRESYVANVGDGETTPTMLTTEVRTFVSDSGYTRYFITSPVWAMYDEAADPHWKFPDTLMMQQYDRDMRVTSTMRCDSATYFTQKRLWRLDGHVRMVNSDGDSFATQQVFWDQAKREVFSDSFIHIVRSDRIIEGYGFTSNEPMTQYSVNLPTGIFPVNRSNMKPAEQEEADSAAISPVDGRRRPSAMPKRQTLQKETSAPDSAVASQPAADDAANQ